MLLTAVLTPAPEGGFTALNPETGTTTQGETVEEAVANLREATELHLNEFPLQAWGSPIVTTFEVRNSPARNQRAQAARLRKLLDEFDQEQGPIDPEVRAQVHREWSLR